jgi:hypothetical protein
MSFWQFHAAVNGYLDTHSPQDDKTLSQDEEDQIWEMIDGR